LFKYSVLMSVYHKEMPDYLSESIKSMLEQTITPDEIIVVKDGPLPHILESVVNDYKIQYPHIIKIIALEKNMGLGFALARGITECRNEWVARMDSDDIAVSNRIETQFNIISKYSDIAMVGSIIYEFIDSIENVVAKRILPEFHDEIFKFAKSRCPVAHPSVLFKKSDVLKCGNYRNIACEDYDLFVRLLQSGVKAYNVQTPLVYVRVSADFYQRRGGIKYMLQMVKFKKELYNTGFYSKKNFIVSAGAHVVVCLLPNSVRSFVYKKMLRE
jgi:glycosyltransferase involved in cell wall biosynthesis